MKTAEQISSEITASIIADPDTEVTFTGIKGALRGYIDAVALKIRDIWYDITQAKRDSLIDTCEGIKLDNYISQRSELVRAPASNAGVLLVLSGAVGTVVPAGTLITNPTTKMRYQTQQAVTIGSKNPYFSFGGSINIKSISLGDIVWAKCTTAGIIGRAPANTITFIGITGVSVVNPAPAQGGSDIETDEAFRERFKSYIKVLNKNTEVFYESITRYMDTNILRTHVEKDYSHPDSVKLTVVAKDGIPLTSANLMSIESQVESKNRSFEIVNCYNVGFTYISVEFQVSLIGVDNRPVDGEKHYRETADAIAKYLDWQTWEWGKAVSTDNLFTICDSVSQVQDIPLANFKINGSSETSIPVSMLPYFLSLKIIDVTSLSAIVVRENLNVVQNYKNLELTAEVI